jgi:hypothetical protein
LNKRKNICHHNKFEILSEEIGNEELSIDCDIEKFINWEDQGNKNGILTKVLAMKKFAKQSPPLLTLKLVVLIWYSNGILQSFDSL